MLPTGLLRLAYLAGCLTRPRQLVGSPVLVLGMASSGSDQESAQQGRQQQHTVNYNRACLTHQTPDEGCATDADVTLVSGSSLDSLRLTPLFSTLCMYCRDSVRS